MTQKTPTVAPKAPIAAEAPASGLKVETVFHVEDNTSVEDEVEERAAKVEFEVELSSGLTLVSYE